jgi:hypothetical protein
VTSQVSLLTGIVKEKSKGLELVLAITFYDGRFNGTWILDIALHFICPLKRIGLLPMSQLMVV